MSRTGSDHTFAVLAYRESPFIDECVTSLRQQEVDSRIVICTSTPSAFLEALSIRHGAELAINRRKEGIVGDWNFALRSASTKYVTLAHQDDLYLPAYSRTCLALAEKDPGNLITFTDYFEQHGTELRSKNANLLIKKALLEFGFIFNNCIRTKTSKKRLLSLGSPVPCPSVMFNLHNLGTFEFSSDFSINMDWDAWLRLAEVPGSFSYARERLMVHRIHRESETSAGLGDNRRAAEDLRLFERLWPRPLARLIARVYTLSYANNG